MPSLVFSKRGKTDFNIPDKLSVPASGCQVGSLVPIALSTALFRIFYSFPVMLSLLRQPISLSVVQHGVCHSNMQSEVQG